MDEISFKIQLGLILPRMKEKIGSELTNIVEELVDIVKQGMRAEDEFEMAPIKEIIMKDFEIFLDDAILPDIEKKVNPPEEEPAEEPQEDEAAEEVA